MHVPSQLAVFIYLGFVAFLFIRDVRERPNVTGALWIPFFWVTISASRFISQWLNIFGFNVGGNSVEDGSPIDAVFFFVLILSGCYVVYRRQVRVAEYFRNNRWVSIYLLYCFIAIVWSDYPFDSFKRWIKLFGQPIMVLIVLTEPDPMESLARMLKRCAYVIVPISVLFIKYFPDLGRAFDAWSGAAVNTGITRDKNMLGADLMILGSFLGWHLWQTWRYGKAPGKKPEIVLCVTLLAMIGWLFHMAHSSTSLVTCCLALAVVLLLSVPSFNRQRIGAYIVTGVIAFVVANSLFGLSDMFIAFLGKDPTFTGRTDIWKLLINWDINPIFGAGYEGFWLGPRTIQINKVFPMVHLNEAHNGYLETYLNLGLLGVALTVVMLLATFFKVQRRLVENAYFAPYRLGYLLAFTVYNWTEAAFRTHTFTFFMFFLIASDYPRPDLVPAVQRSEADSTEVNVEFLSAET